MKRRRRSGSGVLSRTRGCLLQSPGTSEQLPGRNVSITDHKAAALVVATAAMFDQELLNFRFDRGLKHLLGPLADDLVQRTSPLELGPKLHDLHIWGFTAGRRPGTPWTPWLLCPTLTHGVSSCPRRAAEVVENISRIRHPFSAHQHTRFDNSSPRPALAVNLRRKAEQPLFCKLC